MNIRSALKFTFLGQYANQLIQLVSVMVVTRLLSPAEIGLFSIVAVFMFAASAVRGAGVTPFILKEPELDETKLRTSLGVLYVVSGILYLSLAAIAPVLADFYSRESLTELLLVGGLALLLTPLINIPFALLLRDMRFHRTVRVGVLSALSQAATAVGLAYAGFGAVSLCWAMVAGSLTEAFVLYCTPETRTYLRPRFAGAGPLLRFGLKTSASRALAALSLGSPELVLGKLSTLTAVGLFSRAIALTQIFTRVITQAVMPVVLPHFAATVRSGKSPANAYADAALYYLVIAWPFLAVLGFFSTEVITILYGTQWLASASSASILCVWAAVIAVHGYNAELLLAQSRPGLLLAVEVAVLLVRVACIVVGVGGGLEAVAYWLVASGVFELGARQAASARACGLRLRHLFKPVSFAAFVTVATLLGSAGGARIADAAGLSWPPLVVSIGAVAAGVCAVAGIYLVRHPIRNDVSKLAHRVFVAVRGLM